MRCKRVAILKNLLAQRQNSAEPSQHVNSFEELTLKINSCFFHYSVPSKSHQINCVINYKVHKKNDTVQQQNEMLTERVTIRSYLRLF